MARPEARDELQAVADPDPGGERALRRRLDHRPVGDGVGEGDPDLDHVGAAVDESVEQPRTGLQIGIAEHQEGAERALSVQPFEHGRVAAHASSACAWETSLSPRPDRPTRIALSGSCFGKLQRISERMRGFEGAEDAFALGQRLERRERLGVGRADIFRAPAFLEMGMLRTDGGIIEARPRRTRYRSTCPSESWSK